MRASIRLGKIAGIRVGLNVSVLIILAIIVIALAAGQFPLAYPGSSPVLYVVAALITALLFCASLLAHELAHGIAARRNDIEVEEIVLWLFGGVAELKDEPRSPGADFRIAVVGPLTSLAIAVAFGGVAVASLAAGLPDLAIGVLGYLAVVNALLAVFNLVPAAPLDGGRVLRAAVWAWTHDRTRAAIIAARAGRVFGFVLAALGVVWAFSGRGFNGLWLVLIGMFLVNAATAEEQQTKVSSALHGIRVANVMTSDPVTADPNEKLDQFITQTVWTTKHSTYPLVDGDGRLSGLATLNRVRAVPDHQRSDTTLADIACQPEEIPIARSDDQLVDLLRGLSGCSDGRAVVVDGDNRVIGIVSPSDISRAVQVGDLRPFDPYRGQPGADLSTLTGFRS